MCPQVFNSRRRSRFRELAVAVATNLVAQALLNGMAMTPTPWVHFKE
jgi:hypothetical protein